MHQVRILTVHPGARLLIRNADPKLVVLDVAEFGPADPVLIAVNAEFGLKLSLNKIPSICDYHPHTLLAGDFPQLMHICGNRLFNSHEGIDTQDCHPIFLVTKQTTV